MKKILIDLNTHSNMKIDADSIVKETIDIFIKAGGFEILKNCKNLLDKDDYKKIHPTALTPTNIKIDQELFNKEIVQFLNNFEQWGNTHTHLKRYGLALVNQDGVLKQNDPINGSLMAWNKEHPDNLLLETDCLTATSVMQLESLRPLTVFDGFWTRSNVLLWHKGAEFLPHIDTIVPSMWIRFWATMSPNIKVRFYNKTTGCLEEQENIEVGRVYITDTAIVHDAIATDNNVYQLFLSVLPSAKDLVVSNTAH